MIIFWIYGLNNMKETISYVAISCAIIPFFITVIQFFIFTSQNDKFCTLLILYQENNFDFPPLYKFYSSMGFFGSFGMAYFFSRLKREKRVIFQPADHMNISMFLKEIDSVFTRWIDVYHRISVLALSLYSIFVIMSMMKIAIIYIH